MKSVHDKIKSEPHQISQRKVNDFLDLEKICLAVEIKRKVD